MLNNYSLEVIKTFENKELESFKLFLDSPFFNYGNNSESLKVLFEVIVDALKDSNLDFFEKDAVFQRVFPNSPIVDGKLDKLGSELKKLVQSFLSIQYFQSENNQQERDLALLAELRQRGLEQRYFQALGKMKTLDAQDSVEALEKHELQLKLALEEYEWEQQFNKVKGDLNIPNVIQKLDRYYFNKRIWLANVLLVQQKAINLPITTIDRGFNPSEVSVRYVEDHLLFQLSKKIHALLSLDFPPVEQFQQLLSQLQINEKKISREHLAGFYTHLRNICTILIERGYYELRIVQHQIHLDNLSLGYFYYDDKIPSNAFLNITQTALNVNALEWANEFVEAHKERIIGENAARDFYRLNKAICMFAEKKYNKTLEIIPFGSTYSFYHLIARRLELKIYYELDSELLPYKIDAFKMFISRAGNKILSKSLHELHVNFINFLRQLSLSPKGRDKNRSAKMIERINEKKLVADRAWLLEKARELGEGKK